VTQKELLIAALRESGHPMRLADLTLELERRGYRHGRAPRNPRQLQKSVSALLQRDSAFVRVDRGLYDLAE
jgi:HB1, ASXL, restriction endonuclease HTH domain